MKREAAEKLAKVTQHSYDKMAREFSSSRAKFWEELSFLSEHIERDDHVLDIGCGNGRFVPLVGERHAHYSGIDNSDGLLREARKIYPTMNFVWGDATALPFPDNSFDIAFSFAVIHHLPGHNAQFQFMAEALRILHPGGKLILTAWDLWSPRHFGEILKSALHSLLAGSGRSVGDVMLTFGTEKHPRYVHAFTTRELHALLTRCGFEVVGMESVARKSGERNIVVVAQKPLFKKITSEKER